MGYTLGELAQRFGLEVVGSTATEIQGVCTIRPGKAGCLTFLANPRYREHLAATHAAAVVFSKADAKGYAGNGLVAPDPYLAFARIAALFDHSRDFTPGRHPTAVVSPAAQVPASVHVGPQAVIEEGVEIGENSFIGPGCIVRREARIGAGGRLEARVYVGERVRIGKRARIESGVVIGGRGFGLARGPKGWEEVPQLGSVTIGDDVEIGANTTIDRGAIEDTVLEDDVKLDNQIQIAHNCHIGAHTAIAAQSGIAGSTRIGARCMIGGASAVSGHLSVGDDVVLMGGTMVTKSLPERGQYASLLPVSPVREWRRQIGRFRRLHKLEERLAEAERRLNIELGEQGESREDDV